MHYFYLNYSALVCFKFTKVVPWYKHPFFFCFVMKALVVFLFLQKPCFIDAFSYKSAVEGIFTKQSFFETFQLPFEPVHVISFSKTNKISYCQLFNFTYFTIIVLQTENLANKIKGPWKSINTHFIVTFCPIFASKHVRYNKDFAPKLQRLPAVAWLPVFCLCNHRKCLAQTE